MNSDNNPKKCIKLKADFDRCDFFPTKKADFEELCNKLRKKGYEVDGRISEKMSGKEETEIFLVDGNNEHLIFTSSNASAKGAIIDSNISERKDDIIRKIEENMNH